MDDDSGQKLRIMVAYAIAFGRYQHTGADAEYREFLRAGDAAARAMSGRTPNLEDMSTLAGTEIAFSDFVKADGSLFAQISKTLAEQSRKMRAMHETINELREIRFMLSGLLEAATGATSAKDE